MHADVVEGLLCLLYSIFYVAVNSAVGLCGERGFEVTAVSGGLGRSSRCQCGYEELLGQQRNW